MSLQDGLVGTLDERLAMTQCLDAQWSHQCGTDTGLLGEGFGFGAFGLLSTHFGGATR